MATIGTTTRAPTTRAPYTTTTTGGMPSSANVWARWVNLVLGVWLFISAFIWPHTYESMTNTWILGVLIFAASIAAMYVSWFRWVNTVLAIWLFFSTFGFPTVTAGTMWNNAIVAIIVFICSLVPGTVSSTRRTLAPAAT